MLLRLGKIFRKTFRNTYLVRSSTVPVLRQPVFLASGERVGRVLDVFGPVNLPYVEILPETRKELLGEVVYVRGGKHEVPLSKMRKRDRLRI
ncbi:MAG: H/ACA RNA-protein complex protein Gar1 [bacterium]|nr:H/ACA RNA-protein complex protein Gar1 [bacterium]